MPVPDVAILLTAKPSTVTERRPTYSTEYLSSVGEAYGELREYFPELVEIRTDPGEPAFDQLENTMVERLSPSTPVTSRT